MKTFPHSSYQKSEVIQFKGELVENQARFNHDHEKKQTVTLDWLTTFVF